MSLDATEMNLTRCGKVEIALGGDIYLTGFEGNNCSCRDVAVLALSWAIGHLQRELDATIRKPGGNGTVCVD